MSEELSYQENAKIVRERKEREREIFCQESQEDLRDKICKSINTTMIGSLEEIESKLEPLFQEKNISGEQLKEIFKEVRVGILDRGNEARKKAEYHLSRFTVTRNNKKRFNYKFKAFDKESK